MFELLISCEAGNGYLQMLYRMLAKTADPLVRFAYEWIEESKDGFDSRVSNSSTGEMVAMLNSRTANVKFFINITMMPDIVRGELFHTIEESTNDWLHSEGQNLNTEDEISEYVQKNLNSYLRWHNSVNYSSAPLSYLKNVILVGENTKTMIRGKWSAWIARNPDKKMPSWL